MLLLLLLLSVSAFWAASGECERNPGYMRFQCAPACFSCEQLDFKVRCPLSDDLPDHNIWRPGDLNRMFQRIESNFPHADVVLKPQTDVDAPWVVVIDDFLNETECQTIIELGHNRGYEQSKDVGSRQFDGTYDSRQSAGRTSFNTWCLDECYHNATTQNVLSKIENLTGIPDSHAEYLQLLRYYETQLYRVHHDYIAFHTERAQGVRIVTVFLYLNDVEEGEMCFY